MDYNSVNEILESGITNMTVLRDNTKQDDGTDSATGVNWFTFNGTTASTVYVNGNSWIGFGSSSEQLKVNRRDTAMWYLYREEGTLYGYYKFLKLRWAGYSAYNQTSSSYALTYDIILWGTGDISLHMVNIPTSNNNGTYSLVASSTYTYTVSTTAPDVTFKKNDSGFEVSNDIISLEPPCNRRYFIRDGSNYYVVENDALISVAVSELTSAVFLESGMTKLPDLSLLSTLSNPEILYWNDGGIVPSKGLTVSGTVDVPQIAQYELQNVSSYSGIEKAEVVDAKGVLFTLSFDDGTNWKYYDGTTWNTAASESEGMTADTLKNIPASAWANVFSATTLRFRCALTTLSSTVGRIYIKYI